MSNASTMRNNTAHAELRHVGEGGYHLTGRIDYTNAGEILADGKRRMAKHESVTIDASRADVASTPGLAVLMEWAAYLELRDIGFSYRGLGSAVLALAEVNGVTMMLPIHRDTFRG